MPLLLGIGAAALLTGSGLFAAGEGIDEAGNGTLKIAAAAAALYIIYKKVN